MRALRWIIFMVVLAALGWRFPLFHVVPLQQAVAEKKAATFDPAQFAGTFWTNRLLPSLDKAVSATVLLPAIQSNPAAAKKQFARSVGMGESYFYFVAGIGRVVSVSDDEILLAVTATGTNADISLPAGPVFGNALRDGTSLLNVSDYPNSQDFNDISAALNHLVETTVLPILRVQAKVGAQLSFAGCAEVADESSDLKPLHVVPVMTRLLPNL